MTVKPYINRKIFDNMTDQQLQDCYPELFALKGVLQPEKWHPEGDAYEHTMLVLEQAINLYPKDDFLPWMAITHDFGKALTPKEQWPKHYGHADFGVKPTLSFLERLTIDKDNTLVKSCSFTTKFHMHIHNAYEMKLKGYMKLYNAAASVTTQANALVLIEQLCKLGVCDHYGRGNVDLAHVYANPILVFNICKEIHEYVSNNGAKVQNHKDFQKMMSCYIELQKEMY